MKAKVSQYRREGKLALRHMWFVVVIFAVVQVIVSIAVAAANSKSGSQGGMKSAGFAAIWSMFLVIGFTYIGGKIVFGDKSSELLVGFMIGIAYMMVELFFVLMIVFFILAADAQKNGYTTAPPDNAYGAFSLLNMIIYLVWAIILTVHRRAVSQSQQEREAANSGNEQFDGSATYNPTIGENGNNEDFSGDQEEL